MVFGIQPLISGRPKRRIKKIGGFLLRPFKGEIKKRTRKTLAILAKQLFEVPKVPISVEKALEMERKQFLKGKKGKQRRAALKELGEI